MALEVWETCEKHRFEAPAVCRARIEPRNMMGGCCEVRVLETQKPKAQLKTAGFLSCTIWKRGDGGGGYAQKAKGAAE